MKKVTTPVITLCTLCMLAIACQKEQKPDLSQNDENAAAAKKKSTGPATVTVFATGLNNPRGLEFGPDGFLYVAEAGTGGTLSTAGQCAQVTPPAGPTFGSPTNGRVSKIDMNGNVTTVTTQLPSSSNRNPNPSVNGPSDVAFIDNTLYVLIAGGGCSHGVPTFPNGIVRINPNGSSTVIADLGKWLLENPAENTSADFEPEGVWYNMSVVRNEFYAIEPNQGVFVKVSLDGTIKEVADLSASLGHIVPTALDYKGNFFVGNLGRFPIMGNSSIFKINPAGNIKEVATGFSAILGLVIDQQSRMYVLEMTSGAMFPTPFTGRIVRVDPNGNKEVIVSGLSLPTGMTQGPDGNLYVSNWGLGRPAGGGEIVKVDITHE